MMKNFLIVLALLATVHATIVQPDEVPAEVEDGLVSVEHSFDKFPHKFGSGYGFHKGFHKKHRIHKKHKFHPYPIYHKPKVCYKPSLTGHLAHVSKHHYCDWYKPFGFKIKIIFKTHYHVFSYIIKICTHWHKPSLPKKIFHCSLAHAIKKCKYIGLPKCAHHKKFFIHRKKLLAKCLLKAIIKCAPHGIVKLH